LSLKVSRFLGCDPTPRLVEQGKGRKNQEVEGDQSIKSRGKEEGTFY